MVIELTNYEKRSLYRFLSIYLGSVSILLIIIGWLFFKNSSESMQSSLKFEMQYEARVIESKLSNIMMTTAIVDPIEILKSVRSSRFKVGFFDKNFNSIYSELSNKPSFEGSFVVGDDNCFSMIKPPFFKFLNVKYLILQESELKDKLSALKIKIAVIILISFLFMSIIGYYLSKLFMKPIREKIEALDRFIEDTTHELNTPISAILMTVEQLKDIDNKKLLRLKASAKRLSSTYSTLSYKLDAQSLSKDIEVVDLKQFVKNQIEDIEPIAKYSKISIYTNLDPCRVKINRELLKRLIDNILSNAIKYSNPNSKIDIALCGCRLVVKDYGIGIKKDELSEILKRYKRANKERGGFGIGLSIVSSIAKDNKIIFTIDSEYKEGTEVVLDFKNLKTS